MHVTSPVTYLIYIYMFNVHVVLIKLSKVNYISFKLN